jgi:hypothetical protein
MKKQKELTWAEIRVLQAENAKELKELRKTVRETSKQMKETDKRLEKMYKESRELIGGISRSNGEFCEEYFVNCFKENPTLLGERFDRVMTNLYPDPMVIKDEYDLVLRNGSTAALIEMKYKAKIDDVGRMFKKLISYRANYPMFADYKIYLCLASFRFSKHVREKAAEKGIVLIQQRGEKIEVIGENIRTW